MAGGFGERVLDRVVARDTFVPAEVKEVVFSEVVEYSSGDITSSVKMSAPLSVYKRWDERDNRKIRSFGVDPSVYLKVYVRDINKSVLVEMSPSEVVQFGEFPYIHGKFKLTETDVEVKVDAEEVQFENYGAYSIASDVTDTRSYGSFSSSRSMGKIFDKSHRCGREIDEALRKAWAKQEGLYSGAWTVEDVDDPDYTKTVTLSLSHPESADELEFSFSMDEWDENPSMRRLIDEVGSGLVGNLEMEKVWVSMSEYSNVEPVAESGDWKLYAPSDKPNIVSRFVSKWI